MIEEGPTRADERGSIVRYLLKNAQSLYEKADAEEAKGPDNPAVERYMLAGYMLRAMVADIEAEEHRK